MNLGLTAEMHSDLSVALVYNRYLNRGGEDEVFESEGELLEQNGWRVRWIEEQTAKPSTLREAAGLAMDTIWSKRWYQKFQNVLRSDHVRLAHIHNLFPVISPSIYYACKENSVAVVQTLHNYRLLCPSATFFRNGKACEDCLGRVPLPAVVHACYQNSRAKTAVIASMLTIHRSLGTWRNKVDIYIALTEFARQKFIEGGIPPDKIEVKPNFLNTDPGVGDGSGRFVLYVGRLSQEKGIPTLLRAWETIDPKIPLKIVGDGPLVSVVSLATRKHNIVYLGRKQRVEVLSLMQEATFLVVPSECYETFSLTIIEAFATGLPVVVSGAGAMAELAEHGRTGLHVHAGDSEDLATQVEWLFNHPKELAQMRKEARKEYETKYTAKRNYEMMKYIYRLALEQANK